MARCHIPTVREPIQTLPAYRETNGIMGLLARRRGEKLRVVTRKGKGMAFWPEQTPKNGANTTGSVARLWEIL